VQVSRAISHHAEWLELVEISGPFLSLPVLERIFPQGLEVLDLDHATRLRLAREEWAEDQARATPDPEIHDAWIRLVLTETLEYTPAVLLESVAIPSEIKAEFPEHRHTLQPDFVLVDPDAIGGTCRVRLVIQTYSSTQDLDERVPGSDWAASPAARAAQLCRAVGVRLAIVTNGERWMLVDAPVGETAAYVSWYASLWPQEPLTLRAFRSLLGVRRFFGVADSETLEAMLSESGMYQAEVTEQLGTQVRRAVEVLVQALDRADADSGRQLLGGVSESELYQAALTVMMRFIFLFFAEENELLPLSDELYQQFYAASTLRGQLREEADRVGVEVLERRQDAWSRLLATFRAVWGGIDHDALHLPAYGGSLFDPDQFAFLEGRPKGTSWSEVDARPFPIDNRTVLHLLEALQLLQMRGTRGIEARKLSFRALNIEQIGHVYEMLLDHHVLRADTTGLGLAGSGGAEPEVWLRDLQEHRVRGRAALLDFLEDKTKKARSTLERSLLKRPDPAALERLRVACGQDAELFEEVLPFEKLIRTDPWGEPIVIRTGSLVVTSGTERRSTGTYYTPRVLTEEIVTHTFEPLVYHGPAEGIPRDEWKLLRPRELLNLKVCDPAMGSGAFLVQVVRWLSERLVEAWEETERALSGMITSEGERSDASVGELVVPIHAEERLALARRLIADRCIYGVDVNPLAVEMAKLSLWLITLAKGRPFSFLDHALKYGDSLLGVHDVEQIRNFHIEPERGRELHAALFDPRREIEPAIEYALRLRRELEAFTVIDVQDAEAKSAMHHKAEEALCRVRIIGDLLTGAVLSTAGRGPAALADKLRTLGDELTVALAGASGDRDLRAIARAMLSEGKPAEGPERRPFHWPIEFPEVFLRKQGGFDAVIGNPPFKGGWHISGLLGSDFREYLVNWVAMGTRGSADLVVYFLLRMASLVRPGGVLALLATNSLAQGEARVVGLDRLASQDWSIVRARKSRTWPGEASIQIAELWLHHGKWNAWAVLDGRPVSGITPSLDPASRVEGPVYRLNAQSSRSFKGSELGTDGFILSPNEAQELIGEAHQNSTVVLPYLNAADLNGAPDQRPSRWVISFFDWPLDKASQYARCLDLVRQRVRPQILRKPESYRGWSGRWWQYSRVRRELYNAIQDFDRVIVIARHSKTVAPVFVTTGIVFSDATVVLAYDDDAHFGVLSSCFHWWWAVLRGSTIRTDLRYTSTDCFETFPQPALTEKLAAAGKQLDQYRRQLMLERGEGLTTTYNRVSNPAEHSVDIVRLREHHRVLDLAVAADYGWHDLNLDHDFYETPQGVRYTIGPVVRVEVLDRLTQLNHERHAAELAL
jgi:hypothetical protein